MRLLVGVVEVVGDVVLDVVGVVTSQSGSVPSTYSVMALFSVAAAVPHSVPSIRYLSSTHSNVSSAPPAGPVISLASLFRSAAVSWQVAPPPCCSSNASSGLPPSLMQSTCPPEAKGHVARILLRNLAS